MAWIDDLKAGLEELRREQPEGYRELYLFPGVELSVYGGVHVLALFDSSATSSDIDTLIATVKYRGTKGHSDSVTELPFSEVVAEIDDAGGIAIPAHADLENGLLTALNADDRSEPAGPRWDVGIVTPGGRRGPSPGDSLTGWR